MLAQAALEAGAQDESFAFYEELAADHPDVAEVHYGLGRIHAERGEPGPAVEHLRRACELFPSFGAAHFALAKVYRDQGETEKAREHLALYQKDKTGWPTLDDPLLADIVALRNSATDHLRRGIHLAEQGQLEEAAAAHEAALEADPRLVQAHVNLIRIYGAARRGGEGRGALPGGGGAGARTGPRSTTTTGSFSLSGAHRRGRRRLPPGARARARPRPRPSTTTRTS